ncbi:MULTISPECIES: pectinesterase family protein [Paenibacillus]|uniref:pectinesterase family protein n=1 Tax=Paenibacillus TaxID=44249 RepID=UPI0022B868E9|nr:pectinesterase family protein [Paenibacillus caseinilyticus]MCZ8519799.1 pectinesterase family protein [Paenibacillus caseinilyticus]
MKAKFTVPLAVGTFLLVSAAVPWAAGSGTASAAAASNASVQPAAEQVTTSLAKEPKKAMTTRAIIDTAYRGAEGAEVKGVKHYRSLQAAIRDVPADQASPYVIYLKAGIYKEVITVDKPFVTLVGENAKRTIVTYDNASGTPKPDGSGTLGTTGSATVTVKGEDFTAVNVTFENSFDEANSAFENKQAVAIKTQADRAIFKDCRFIGNQDTLYPNLGRQYFADSYIEGDVDFIFGAATAVFENSRIHSLDRGSDSNNGYVTAASTLNTNPYGYLFINCRLTSDPGMKGTVSLGRPWQPGGNTSAVASVVFKNTHMGSHITGTGWVDMGASQAANARFFEYGSRGPGAIASPTRPQLTKEQADLHTPEAYFGDWEPKKVLKQLERSADRP